MSSQNGWIKLHRQILESSVFENPLFLKVWLWCLMKASHVKTKIPFSGGDLELNPGEFVTGRDKACKFLKTTHQRYRTALDYLKSTSRISIKTTNKFSIITILNWDTYQNEYVENNQQNNQQVNQPVTSKQPASNQPVTTNKNVKNVNNGNNENKDSITENFEKFWSAYPKHVEKKEAFGVFKGLNPDEVLLKTILDSIEKNKAGRAWQDGYIPSPKRWLKGARWNDDTDGDQPKNPVKKSAVVDVNDESTWPDPETLYERHGFSVERIAAIKKREAAWYADYVKREREKNAATVQGS